MSNSSTVNIRTRACPATNCCTMVFQFLICPQSFRCFYKYVLFIQTQRISSFSPMQSYMQTLFEHSICFFIFSSGLSDSQIYSHTFCLECISCISCICEGMNEKRAVDKFYEKRDDIVHINANYGKSRPDTFDNDKLSRRTARRNEVVTANM